MTVQLWECDVCSCGKCYCFDSENENDTPCSCIYKNGEPNWVISDDYTLLEADKDKPVTESKLVETKYFLSILWKEINFDNVIAASKLKDKNDTIVKVLDTDTFDKKYLIETYDSSYWTPMSWVTKVKPMDIEMNDVIYIVKMFIRNEKKINAIKFYRTITGLGLKESKKSVEAIMANM